MIFRIVASRTYVASGAAEEQAGRILPLAFPTYAIWGANTNVGKTLASAGLAAAAVRQKVRGHIVLVHNACSRIVKGRLLALASRIEACTSVMNKAGPEDKISCAVLLWVGAPTVVKPTCMVLHGDCNHLQYNMHSCNIMHIICMTCT